MSGPTASRLERGWLHERPMNEEEDEVTQARLIQAARKDRANYPQAVPGRTWIYRQSVKAEPWDKTVRDKISDPAWSGFFLHYGDSYDYSLPICRDANLSKPGCNTWPACDRSQPPTPRQGASRLPHGRSHHPTEPKITAQEGNRRREAASGTQKA